MTFTRKSTVFATVFCCVVSLSSCNNSPNEPSKADAEKKEEQTLLKALAEQQAVLPKDSPQLETPLENVASFYEIRSQYDLAEKYLEQMITCHETNWNWERLSLALAEQKKFDQAIEAMKKSVAIVEAKNKSDDTAAVYIRYAKLLEQAGRQSKAAPLRKKAHELAPNIKNSTIRWHKNQTMHY